MDDESKNKLKKVEEELSDKCAEKNFNIIKNEIEGIHCQEGGINSGKLWKLKKKMISKVRDPPSYKTDKFGNIIATASVYKQLNEDTQGKRSRPSKSET